MSMDPKVKERLAERAEKSEELQAEYASVPAWSGAAALRGEYAADLRLVLAELERLEQENLRLVARVCDRDWDIKLLRAECVASRREDDSDQNEYQAALMNARAAVDAAGLL